MGDVRAGEAALAEYHAARVIGLWALGQPEARDETEVPPSTQWLPQDPQGVGHWLALGLAVDPSRWLRLPPDVVWPDGSMRLVEIALEGAQGFVELRDRGVLRREVEAAMLLGTLPLHRRVSLDRRSVFFEPGRTDEVAGWLRSSPVPVLLDHDPDRTVGWCDKAVLNQDRALLVGGAVRKIYRR